MSPTAYRNVLVNDGKAQVIDLSYWGDIRFDANDLAPDYIGMNLTNGAATTADDWKIFKFTYDGANATRIQLAYGTWDGRAALFP